MRWLRSLLALGASLFVGTGAYNVEDLTSLNLRIIKSNGDLLSFDLALNQDNQFSATIQNLDAGLTNITLNGYNKEGVPMYNGDWEGQVRQDGKPTQVELYMVDLKPDIDVATIDNIAPFFVSIEIEPSNIAKNETTQIRTRAKDLDDGESALNYSFRALDDLYGTVTPCPNASEYCTTEYLSTDQDTNGLKEFEIDVSDGQVYDTVKGGFNIRAYGGIDLIINFNSRPGVSSISTGNVFLYDQEGYRSTTVNLTLFDDGRADWEVNATGTNDTICDVAHLSGPRTGSFLMSNDLSLTFTPPYYDDSECTFTLTLTDDASSDLVYQVRVPVYVGNKLHNTAPYISHGYSTASSSPENTNITYVVHALDKGVDNILTPSWTVQGAGSVIDTSQVNSTTHLTPEGFVAYTFTLHLNSSGQAGSVHCEVEDQFQLKTDIHFVVSEYQNPRPSPAPSASSYSTQQSGQCATPITTAAECEAAISQLGYTNMFPMYEQSFPYDPSGCFVADNVYQVFNSESTNEQCSSFLVCICGDSSRRLRFQAPPASHERRLTVASEPSSDAAVSPFVFGLSMAIQNRTLTIRSNTVPRRTTAGTTPAAPVPSAGQPTADNKEDSGSGRSKGVLWGVSAAVAAMVVLIAMQIGSKRSSQKPTSVTSEKVMPAANNPMADS